MQEGITIINDQLEKIEQRARDRNNLISRHNATTAETRLLPLISLRTRVELEDFPETAANIDSLPRDDLERILGELKLETRRSGSRKGLQSNLEENTILRD